MCWAVYFNYGAETMRVYFPNPKAMLPVLKKDGSLALIPWGRRSNQHGKLPITGWAKIESIYCRKWESFFPKPVKIPALSFMEKDLEDNPHWYDLQKGQYIQGLLARARRPADTFTLAQSGSKWRKVPYTEALLTLHFRVMCKDC